MLESTTPKVLSSQRNERLVISLVFFSPLAISLVFFFPFSCRQQPLFGGSKSKNGSSSIKGTTTQSTPATHTTGADENNNRPPASTEQTHAEKKSAPTASTAISAKHTARVDEKSNQPLASLGWNHREKSKSTAMITPAGSDGGAHEEHGHSISSASAASTIGERPSTAPMHSDGRVVMRPLGLADTSDLGPPSVVFEPGFSRLRTRRVILDR